MRDEIPGMAEARAQERADKAANDELEALLNPPPDENRQYVLDLAADAIERSERAKSADPVALARQLTERTLGPADDDEIRAEPVNGSYEWRVAELERMGIGTYTRGGAA